MARYQPPVVPSSFDRVKGPAEVQLHKTGKAKISFRDGGEYIVAAENVQAEPVWAGKAFCEVSEDGKYFFSMRPWKGLYPAVCTGIVSGEGEEPKPKVHNGKFGEFLTFTSLIQVREGKYQGVIYPMSIPYRFAEHDGVAGLMNELGRSKYTDKMVEYMYIVGAWDTALDWSENLLPEIHRRIVNAERGFMIAVKEGYVDQLIDADEDDDDVVTEDW